MLNLLIFLILIFLIIILVYIWLKNRSLYSSINIIEGNTELPYDKLMIVAHPDDELIFGGRYLLAESGWKVVSITNASDKSKNKFCPKFKSVNRQSEFTNVMNAIPCVYEIWDFEDNLFSNNWNEELLKAQINRVLKEKSYKMILTHNSEGEYGHVQHRKVHQIIANLNPPNLYVFHTDEKVENPYLKQLEKLLQLYKSQSGPINKHYDFLLHQSILKI